MLTLQPITWQECCDFIRLHHRHHPPSAGWKFGIAVNDGSKIVGVISVGRPVARQFDDGLTLEVNRCCTDGTKNACSMLYAAAWRAARALGYKRLITYTLTSEPGSSLRALGWKKLHEITGRSWTTPKRFRIDRHVIAARTLWEAA